MVAFCLFGAGVMGTVHAANIADHPEASLRTVVDVAAAAGRAIADQYGAVYLDDADAAINDPNHDAVLIASDARTHADLAARAARAGKAIFCEKPLDADVAKAEAGAREVEAAGVPFQIGFHRRYDPNYRGLHQAVASGEIGDVALMRIVARQPEAPSREDVAKLPANLWKDLLIHDLDLARWVMGEEPVEVFATASCLFAPWLKEAGEVDTIAMTLRTRRGALCQISAGAGSAYGFDQRAEVIGSVGMAAVDNLRSTTVERYAADGAKRSNPPADFLERYTTCYREELDHFIDALNTGAMPTPGLGDGLQALKLAEAGIASARTGAPVAVTG